MIKSTIISFLFLTVACNGTKETLNTKASEYMEQEKEMIAQGFTKGTIEHSRAEGDCEYTIKLEDGRYFESSDLKDEYKEDGMNVWFSFRPLRRMSMCNKANPVSIEEMKKG